MDIISSGLSTPKSSDIENWEKVIDDVKMFMASFLVTSYDVICLKILVDSKQCTYSTYVPRIKQFVFSCLDVYIV